LYSIPQSGYFKPVDKQGVFDGVTKEGKEVRSCDGAVWGKMSLSPVWQLPQTLPEKVPWWLVGTPASVTAASSLGLAVS